MKYLTEYTREGLFELVKELNLERYRADQIYTAIYKNYVKDIDSITTLSKELRTLLKKEFTIFSMKKIKTEKSKIDRVEKILWQLSDGNKIESVIIKGRRTTLCLSTQVGCPIKCTFCASGRMEYRRNLTMGEIIEQVLQIGKIKIDNIVFMGIGEPMLNLNNVISAIKTLNFGARKVTISTIGLPEKIKYFADLKTQIRLAISLHSANERKRKILVPNSAPLYDIFRSIEYYQNLTNRMITFEYVLLKGVNDSLEDAKEFVEKIKKFKCKVNLIMYNPNKFSPYEEPLIADVQKFKDYLLSNKIIATVRKRLGADINSACGQLAVIEK